MVKKVDLLERGYFPKELPPPFTTESFRAFVEHNPAQVSGLSGGPRETLPVQHSLFRAGTVRRLLSIPNPISFLPLAEWFERNWAVVEDQCRKSTLSLSKLILPTKDRAVVAEVALGQLPTHRARLRAKSRYILKTDLTNCYPSIYTHSVSWAVHTKAKAKANRRSRRLAGNQLDQLIRNAQHGQTVGIPVGPDTSLIIAEMILSSVDKEFCHRMRQKLKGKPNGYRSYDDFELGFTTRSEAEVAVATLQSVLMDYELQLNPAKTTIVELPVPMDSVWASELSMFRLGGKGQRWALQRYFDRAFELSGLNRDLDVLKYAIRRLDSVNVAKENWQLLQDLLLQCAMVEPSTLPVVVNNLHVYRDKGFRLDKPKVGEVFNVMLSSHAPLGHGSEVAWSLWACLLFRLRIRAVAACAVTEMEDSVVALLWLHARASGLIRSKTQVHKWQAAMTGAGLRDRQWLLSYEANIKGWLQSAMDYVSQDSQFGILKAGGVSFYDASKVGSHTPSGPHKPPVGGPDEDPY